MGMTGSTMAEALNSDIWTVKRILDWIEGYLGTHGDENPRVSAQWLVADALGVSRMQLFLDPDRPLTNDERTILRDWTRRRAQGEPLQYITGEAAFRHISVKVRSGVLIPRPETEVLVSEALALLPAARKPQDDLDWEMLHQFVELGGTLEGAEGDELPIEPKLTSASLLVADICTGTGCIACSIASERPDTRVIATDISSEAIALAHENVDALDLGDRVKVIECDLGSGVSADLLGAFDLVVSNPPYIPTDVLATLPGEVSDHEPALALDGGLDGLELYRRLLAWCSTALKPGGGFACELHETCLDQAAELAKQAGLSDVRITRDLANRPRVLTARAARR